MNLFLLGWSRSEPVDVTDAKRALFSLVEQLPFFEEQPIQTWQAPSGRLAVACISHHPDRVGGVRYTVFEADRMALFSGRPIAWTDEFEADGQAPLDPRFYLRVPERWADRLDGRYVAVRYDDPTATLDICTDPLGTYNVYQAERNGVLWFSNNSELVRNLASVRAINPLVLASMASCGWSLGGHPLWADVRCLERASVHRFSAAPSARRDLVPARSIGLLLNRGFNVNAATRTLLAAARALSDWPGRPSYVALTGGRDSRLVFAAALKAGVEFEPWNIVRSKLRPETPDAMTARLLCAKADRSLRVEAPERNIGLEEAARLLRLTERGTLQLDLAWGALTRPYQRWEAEKLSSSPLPIVHSGLSGELARGVAAVGNSASATDLASKLYHRTVQMWPRPLLSREGKYLLRVHIVDWVNERLDDGVGLGHLPDLFYLEERTARFNAAANGFDEYMLDLTAPLRTYALLPHELGLPAEERARELFHFHVLQSLAPEFTRLPFSESNPPWPTFGRNRPQRARRLQTAARRAERELLRRGRHLKDRRRAMSPEEDLLAGGVRLALDRAGAYPQHEVWRLVDRRRALSLLRRDPRGLDVRSRRNLWRLATVLLTCVE